MTLPPFSEARRGEGSFQNTEEEKEKGRGQSLGSDLPCAFKAVLILRKSTHRKHGGGLGDI